jgi:hypothetical protein
MEPIGPSRSLQVEGEEGEGVPMHRARLVATILALSGVILVCVPGVGHAGGSTMDFGRRFIISGTTVTARGWFGSGGQASVNEGPWFAHLQTMGGGTSTGRYLAPVSVVPRDDGTWSASVTFTVPDVPAGEYLVAVCDRGCHQGVGDMVGAPTVIATSPEEGRLFLKMERADLRARIASRRLKKSVHDQAALQQQTQTQADALDAQAGRIATLRTQVAALRSTSSDSSGGLVPWAIGGILIVILLVALSGYEFGRRRPRWPSGASDPFETAIRAGTTSAR